MTFYVMNRRELMGVGALAGGFAALTSSSGRADDIRKHVSLDFDAVRRAVPVDTPTVSLVLEALVEVGPLVDIGASPLGHRRIVTILGGQFAGSRLRGEVLPGGADRQLVRVDGVRMLQAVYELKTDDGVIISVSNRVIIDDPVGARRYARSAIELSAPEGRYGWLNNRIFVGTLQPLQPQHAAVLVRVFEVG